MSEAAPELEPKLPLVEVGVKFHPFEYENTLPEITSEEGDKFFTRKLALRGVDDFILTFDQNTNPETLKEAEAVLITHNGVKRIPKGSLTPSMIEENELFEFVIDASNKAKGKSVNWYLELPGLGFKASGLLDKRTDIPSHLFRDEQTGNGVSVFVQRNLKVLKNLELQFLRRQKLTPIN